MKCPDLEEIIRFASTIPTEADADLAAHIATCKTCQKDLVLAIDVITCNNGVTDADIVHANSIITRRNSFAVLSDIVNFISENLNKMPLLSLASLKIPHLHPTVLFAFASGGKTKIHTQKKSPEIPFVSTESRCSLHYWKASLQLPLVLHQSSSIQVKVSDASDRCIAHAVLTLGGISMQICNGKAELSVDDFKKSAMGHEIVLKFPDNYISHGVIALQ